MGSHGKRIKEMESITTEIVQQLNKALAEKKERVLKLEARLSYAILCAEYAYVVYSSDLVHCVHTTNREETENGCLLTVSLTRDFDLIGQYNQSTAIEFAEHFKSQNPNKNFLVEEERKFEAILLESEKADIVMINETLEKLLTK